MRSKRLLQVLVVFVMMFSTMGSSKPGLVSTNSNVQADPIVINRNLSIWEASYIGFVSSSIVEKWHVDFTEPENFEVSVTTAAGDLVPLVMLLDANGTELAHGVGSVSSSQPAGTYYIQVQPDLGSGFYFLKLKQLQIVSLLPTVTTTASPASVNAGESALVTVTLSNVPAEGYTSAEFTCTYDSALLEASNIVAGSLFGADAAVAINGPQNGSFIVAIAGSNGNKATTDGTVFTFNVKGLLTGQSAVDCTARVSTGNNVLTAIEWVGTSVSVTGTLPTDTPTPFPTATQTSTPDGTVEPTFTSTPDGSPAPTQTSTPDGTVVPTITNTPDGSPAPTFTSTPDGTLEPTATLTLTPEPTFTNTPDGSPTVAPTFTSTPGASPTPLPDGSVSGKVIASKVATVGLYDTDGNLVVSAPTANDGAFQLSAPAGTYTLVAVASGFLTAQGEVTLTSGSTVTQPDVTLLAGDIDGNDVIDQFDALTIGMSYNTSTPAAADLNNDGTINVLDLELLAQNYREVGPIAWQ
ncbi:MAG: carboxypeptidase regulatory-like domain-containing protein [Anaerolineales bacterium]